MKIVDGEMKRQLLYVESKATALALEVCYTHGQYQTLQTLFPPGYIRVINPYNDGYGHIECDGSEESLVDCVIGPVSSEECEYVGVVNRCSYGMRNTVLAATEN